MSYGVTPIRFAGAESAAPTKETQPKVEPKKASEKTKSDTLEKSNESNSPEKSAPLKKEGFIQGLKNFTAGFSKLIVATTGYGIGAIQGAIKGVVAGIMTFAALTTLKGLRAGLKARSAQNTETAGQSAIKSSRTFLQEFKRATGGKKWGRVLASNVVAAGTVMVSLYNASLKVSERNSAIDHRFNTGHSKKESVTESV